MGNYAIDMQPHQMKQTFTLKCKKNIYQGLNIVGNILDNVNTQLNILITDFNADMISIILL